MRSILVALAVAFSAAGLSGSILAQPEPAESSSTSVIYKKDMVIVGTNDGAALIVFEDATDKKAHYRFRYLSKDGKTKLTGTGEVFEKYKARKFLFLEFLSDDGSKLRINAGPIQLGWSAGNAEQGWIYNAPKKMRVTMSDPKDFDTKDLHQFMLHAGQGKASPNVENKTGQEQ
jgi:hypothetical protein